MLKETINKYVNHFLKAQSENICICEYCEKNLISIKRFYNFINKLKKDKNIDEEEREHVLNIWESIKSKRKCKNSETNQLSINFEENSEETVETDDKAEISYVRDDNGKIKLYKYQIFKKNKNPLCGTLTREEMSTIHRLYSYYGDSLTQRMISRHFVDISLIDFKRILRAFNITKASAPFAPHMIEECTENELRDIQLREKENSFLRKAEEDQIKNNEKLLRKYAQENIDLRKQLETLSNFQVSIGDKIKPVIIPEYNNVGQSINLYLSDIHLGAKVVPGSMYKENLEYGFDEAKRRLVEVLKSLSTFGCFDTFNLVLLGDNVDCAGFTGRTARLDHYMPENMEAREQANKFIELIMWFIDSITHKDRELLSKLRVFSVPCGNHGGTFEYMCNKALLAYINAKYPQVETTLWDEFYGVFEQNSNIFVCCHGNI